MTLPADMPTARVTGTYVLTTGTGATTTPTGTPLEGLTIMLVPEHPRIWAHVATGRGIALGPLYATTDAAGMIINPETGLVGYPIAASAQPGLEGSPTIPWVAEITDPLGRIPTERRVFLAGAGATVNLPLAPRYWPDPEAGSIPQWEQARAAAEAVAASMPDLASAALAEGIEVAKLVRQSDRGAPRPDLFYGENGEIAADMDEKHRASRIIYSDGRQHFPRLSFATASIPEAGYWTAIESEDYSFALVDPSRRIGFSIDRKGGLSQWMVDRIAAQLPGMGGPVVVVPVLGQSNATEADDATAELAYDSGNKVMLWSPELGRGLPFARTAAWIGSGVAREISARYPNQRVLIVRCSMGETGFTSSSLTPPPAGHTTVPNGTWDRTLTTDPKNLALEAPPRIKAALAWARGQDSGSWLDGLIWSQGEQDRALTQAQYAARLDDLLTWLRGELTAPDLPIVVTGFEPQWSRDPANNTSNVEAALRDTPRRLLRTAFHDGPDNLGDPSGLVHWSGEGQELRGRQLVDALVRARLNRTTSEPISPQALTVTRSGNLVEISWQPPPCRVTAYTLEVSTDGGATWAAQALTEPLALTHEMAVTSTTRAWVRVKATNEVGTSEPTKAVKR